MELMLIIIGALLVLGFIVFIVARREATRHETGTAQEAAAICSIVLHRTVAKRVNLEKIRALFRQHPELSNLQIQQASGIPRRSTARYLDDLEKEGFVEQIGNIGRGVNYRIK